MFAFCVYAVAGHDAGNAALRRTGLVDDSNAPSPASGADTSDSAALGSQQAAAARKGKAAAVVETRADAALGGTMVIAGTATTALPTTAAAAPSGKASKKGAGSSKASSGGHKADPKAPLIEGQRPEEIDPLEGTAVQDVHLRLAAIEQKKLFNAPKLIPIRQLHRPPQATKTLPSLTQYEIRAIMESYVQMLVDRRRLFNSTNVLPGLAIPFDRKTHQLIILDEAEMRRDYKKYDYIVIGGSHSREAMKRLHFENLDNPQFHNMSMFIYVGLSVGDARLLARQHNSNQAFSRDMSHNEIIQMMHSTFEAHGKDKTWKVKKIALSEIGYSCDNATDAMSKRWDCTWQLACHDGEAWALLSQIFKMTLKGTLKGQDKKGKKFLEASSPSEQGDSGQGLSKKRGRKPVSDRPPGNYCAKHIFMF